jgi:hypothetical protein
MKSTVFNEAQLHILNMTSHIKTAANLEKLKNQLVQFYAQQIDEDMEQLWQTGELNEDKLNDLRTAHMRKTDNH